MPADGRWDLIPGLTTYLIADFRKWQENIFQWYYRTWNVFREVEITDKDTT